MNDNLHICSQQSVNKTAKICQKVVFFTNEALRRRKKIPPLPIDVKKYAEFESDLRKIHLWAKWRVMNHPIFHSTLAWGLSSTLFKKRYVWGLIAIPSDFAWWLCIFRCFVWPCVKKMDSKLIAHRFTSGLSTIKFGLLHYIINWFLN